MKKIGIMAAAAMALSSIAVTSVAASAQEAESKPEKEKKICRVDKMTGSLTRRTRICMTEKEWRELAARTRKGLEEMGQAASGGTNSAWDPASNGQ